MDILNKAHDIVFDRSEEKTRQYGEFVPEMERTARVLSEVLRKEITVHDCFMWYIVTKCLREGNAYKEDNLLDIVAYAAALNEYEQKKELLSE